MKFLKKLINKELVERVEKLEKELQDRDETLLLFSKIASQNSRAISEIATSIGALSTNQVAFNDALAAILEGKKTKMPELPHNRMSTDDDTWH